MATAHDSVEWHCHITIEKFEGDPEPGTAEPIEVVEIDGNLLMYGGASNLWQCLIGNGTASGGAALTYFNNANAYLGVGDGATAAAATQTDLQGTNKFRKTMNATYPQHTDATTAGAATITFQATLATGEANFAWEEAAIFNASTGGRMLNRKVQTMGTKTSATSWQTTITLTVA